MRKPRHTRPMRKPRVARQPSKRKEDYVAYITSPAWYAKRALYKSSHCELCCSVTNLDLHHLDYKNLYNETADDLSTLCRFCHLSAHINFHKGQMRRSKGPSKAVAKLIRRIRLGSKLRPSCVIHFLERRYFAEFGVKQQMNFLRSFYAKYIKNKRSPFIEIAYMNLYVSDRILNIPGSHRGSRVSGVDR